MRQRCLVLTKPYWLGLTSRAGAPWSPSSGWPSRRSAMSTSSARASSIDMTDRRARWNRRLDDHAIEGLEGDPLPVQVGGRPPSHAVKVGGELSAGKRRELGQWQGEGFAHGAADLDHGIDGDSGRGAVEVRTEAREPIDGVLAGGKRHAAPCQDAERVPARQSRSPSRRIYG